MTQLEEIERMQKQGLSDQEIASALQKRGLPPEKIEEALAQSKIKEAVSQPEEVPSPNQYQDYDMQPSMLSQEQYNEQYVQQPAQPTQEYPQYAQEYPQQQQQYQYPQQQSSDLVSEIAEQIVTEKMSSVKKEVEKISDFKNMAETKISYLESRLNRIEQIIDKLQLSILQKVGEYVTNTEDIKKELVETQKSFKALLPEIKKQKKE